MTYLEYKSAFFKRHRKANWTVRTSGMEHDCYHKDYVFSDGAILSESNRPYYETVSVTVEVHGIPTTISKTIKLFETEAWNTDDPKSVKFYEPW